MAWDWEGAGTGAAGGALAGTMVAPGIGTAIGGAGGFLLGGMMGEDLSAQSDPYRFTGLHAASRADQTGTIEANKGWALRGEGPSNAQALIEKNRADNAARAMGMAKSMPGGDSVLANRAAQEAIQQGDAAASFQGALMRNQEQQQAMNNLIAQENARRAQDIAVYQTQQQVAQQNAANRTGFLSGMLGIGGGGGGLLGGLI